MPRPLLVNAAELLRRAGQHKTISCAVAVTDLGLQDSRFAPDVAIGVDLHLESLTDGIVVTGQLAAPWVGQCRRCLRDLADTAVCVVDELYQLVVTDDGAFPIDDGQLNLVPMVRECVLLDAPSAPLCRPDCKGLCLQCGVDHNETMCSCEAPKKLSQWDVLDQLRSELNEK
jgi:uncharacterized protein